MQLTSDLTGRAITLDPSLKLGIGGEATVYGLPDQPFLAAKVYHRPTQAHARKLELMLEHPPGDPMAEQGHCSIAWPVDLLRPPGRRRRAVGYLMPKVVRTCPVIDVYSPHARLRQRPWFDYQRLMRTGYNLAKTVSAVHDAGYVIGDLNHTNILVSDGALVTLIDTDSFQVRDPRTGEVHRCPVFTPEFTPPELQRPASWKEHRSPEHDCFGLAVLIFLLLMGGGHPFAGIYDGRGEPPPLAARIAAGHFPYSSRRRVPFHASLFSLPWDTLHYRLRELFLKCFEDGHEDPAVRPSGQAWQEALLKEADSLVTCASNGQHLYAGHLESCPWCQRAEKLGGWDLFPSEGAVARGQHIKSIPVPQTLPPDRVAPWQVQRRLPTPASMTPGYLQSPWAWFALALTLGLVAPGVWALAATTFPAALPFVAALAALLYGMTASVLVVAAWIIGWRRAGLFPGAGWWMLASVLGVLEGGGLIALTSLLTVV